MGNPNVGKSVFFSRLTGTNVIASNYPGTTVGFTRGKMKLDGQVAEVIDVPGTYTLEPTCRAEEVAVEMLKEGDVIIQVVDATNLERNLYLTLQLLEKGKPLIVALNLWDEAKHIGIDIDVKRLEKLLEVPVVPTVAITGEGIKELVLRLTEARAHAFERTDAERWKEVGRISSEVQCVAHRHHTLLERLGDLTIKPRTGIPLSILVLYLVFKVVRLVGEGLITYLLNPLFNLYTPLAMRLSALLGPGVVHDILIGHLIAGKIDYAQSMGLLTTGLYVPFAMVLPYVFAFYLTLSFLEDVGYLPRLAVLMDNIMHRLGMHGSAIIPMFLGFGCNVPGVLATRVLETRRQRFIAATLLSIAVPCSALLAMIMGLVGRYGPRALGMVFGTLFVVWLILGFLLDRILKGESPEIFLEIPPYRTPYLGALLKKLWMRVRWFLTEGVPYVLLGVLIINVFYVLGVVDAIAGIAAPVVVGILGLPGEAAIALIAGFLRKDVAVGMLLPLGLNMKQLIIASVVLSMYFPCVATFAVLVRELGIKDMAKSAGIMICSAILVGGLLNLIL
ncbi:MAG: ferrous iron transporter B [Actinomycetota bacterium]|nr:ferrous iron transporter B [Actinomycetota bacterium]